MENSLVGGRFHLADVVLVAWPVSIPAVGMGKAHQHEVAVVHTPEDKLREEVIAVALILGVEYFAEVDIVIEEERLG